MGTSVGTGLGDLEGLLSAGHLCVPGPVLGPWVTAVNKASGGKDYGERQSRIRGRGAGI